MDKETLEMVRKLESKGYMVIKKTKNMVKDENECCELDSIGESKDCLGCSCNICLMQIIKYS